LSSSTIVTVTVCSVFQLVLVKVSEAGETVATLLSWLVSEMVMDAVGA